MNPNQNKFQLNQFSSFQLPPLQKKSPAPKQIMSYAPPEQLAAARVAGVASKAQPRTINPTQSQAKAQASAPAKTKAPAQAKAPTPKKIEIPKNVLSSAEQDYQKKLQNELQRAYETGLSQITSDISSLTARQPELETQIQSQYGQLVPGVERQRETALAEARRQFESGLQRGQQVFGGVAGSSAAQAVQDVASQELLRQQGNIQTQTAEALNKINTDKQNALFNLRSDFRKQLDAINAQRYELASQKSNAQLQALQDFAGRRRQLEDFYTQQQSSIQAEQRSLANQLAAEQRALQQRPQPLIQQGSSYLAGLGFNDAQRKQAIDYFLSLGDAYLSRNNLRRVLSGGREVLQDTQTGETFDVATGANITVY